MSGVDLVARLLGWERRPAAKAAPSVNGVQMPYVWPAWRAGQPDWTPATLQGYAEAGYESNSLVLACIRRRAQSAAFAPLVAYTGTPDRPAPLERMHPLMQVLRKPNAHQSWYEFMELAITYLDLDGNTFIYQARVRPTDGFPAALYLLRSDRVRVVPGRERTEPLLGYVYDAEDAGAWLTRAPFLPDEIIHVKYPHPRDPFEGYGRGTSPLGAATKQVDVDNAATSFLKHFFDQGVVPYGLLKSKQTLVDEEVARIRERLKAQYAGQQNWGETLILDADADYQRMGMSFQEMTFGDLDARNEVRICQALDVPPILVGAKVGLDRATYSNYAQARAAFWQDMLIPGVYQRFEDAFDAGLGTAEVWLAYDYSNVPALREDETAKAETASRLFLGGLVTRGEGRALADPTLPPIRPEDDGFRAMDEQQIGSPAITQTPVRVTGTAERDADDADDTDLPASAGEDGEDDEGGASSKRRPFGTREPQDAKARDDGYLKARLRIERTWAPKIRRALQRQLRLALPVGTTAQDVWQAVGRLDAGQQAVSDAIYQMMRAAVQVGLEAARTADDAAREASLPQAGKSQVAGAAPAGDAERKLELEIDWALVNNEVLGWLKTYLFDLVSRLQEHSREALRAAIARWVENGLPLQDLVDELTPMFGPVRAEMIAATEVTRAFAMANLTYWQATGVARVAWRCANDEVVCPVCSALGGVSWGEDGVIPTSIAGQEENAVSTAIGQPFVHPGGNGKQGKYEGQKYEMPPAHPRCRCWISPEG